MSAYSVPHGSLGKHYNAKQPMA